MAKIAAHTHQICGLSWAPDGRQFASGGNDNLCCLFDVDTVLSEMKSAPLTPGRVASSPRSRNTSHGFSAAFNSRERAFGYYPQDTGVSTAEDGSEYRRIRTSDHTIINLGPGSERYCWIHGAAVKAMAFCPWRNGLLATGGGSSDRAIHFFHTSSGAALATIDVSAQVTSLIWSTTKREIVATFGYPQPSHPYRVAIFSWPDCAQVGAIS